MMEQQETIVRRYVRYLKLERGLSANTLEAYQRDLEKLLVYLKQTGKHVVDVQLEDLQAFAAGSRNPEAYLPYSPYAAYGYPKIVSRASPHEGALARLGKAMRKGSSRLRFPRAARRVLRYSSPKLMPSMRASRTRSLSGSTYFSFQATSSSGTRHILPPTCAIM